MIMDRVISHLRNSGFTVYKAGNNSDIERKPCVVIGMAGPAREYTLSMILINNRSDSEMERFLVETLFRLDCGEQCDFFNITDYSAALDDDDWVTTWTLRYIER